MSSDESQRNCGDSMEQQMNPPELLLWGVLARFGELLRKTAAYLSLSIHLQMQCMTTPAITETKIAVTFSTMEPHLLSAGGTAAYKAYHIFL